MAIETNEELQARIDLIKNETVEGANTATRIGETLEAIKDSAIKATPEQAAHASIGTVTLTFDENRKVYPLVEQTGDIAIELADSGNESGNEIELSISGNTTGSLELPAGWITNGNNFDPEKLNDFYLKYKHGRVTVNLIKSAIPDETPPELDGLAYSDTAGLLITIPFDETINIDDAVVVMSGGRTNTLDSTATAVLVTVNSAYSDSDTITYSISGVKDAFGNVMTPLTGQAVTNNVTSYVNTKSISFQTSQLVKTAVNPTAYQFGTGVGELPRSYVATIKVSSFAADQYIFLIGDDATFGILAKVTTAGKINYLMSSSAGLIQTTTDASISLNTWTRVVITYSAATRTAADFKIYFDAVNQALTAGGGSAYAGQASFPSTTRFAIGSGTTQSAAAPATATKIDEAMVVNVAMTQLQVTEDFETEDKSDLSFYANVVDLWLFEDSLVSEKGNYNLTAALTVSYSTDHP
jgi:hypothetical protein